jgi:hypothetical protein
MHIHPDALPSDPIELNRYVYAGNLPVSYTDPSGQEYDMASVSIAIAIVSVVFTFGRHAAHGGNV